MKKAILILTTILISTFMISTAYAGSLNIYEMDIVNAARATYEYEGVDYVVKSEYINELIEYLAQNDIDLNEQERDTVLQKAFANVARGVEEGYMIPAQSVPVETMEDEENIPEADLNQVDDNSQSSNELKEESEGNSATVDKVNDDDVVNTSKVNEVENIISGSRPNNTQETGNMKADHNSIIKDTGFDLSKSIYTLVGMGILMIAGMLVTFKYNLFARQNE